MLYLFQSREIGSFILLKIIKMKEVSTEYYQLNSSSEISPKTEQRAVSMGGTTSIKAVTERFALQMTAVYSFVPILAEVGNEFFRF